MKNVPQHTNPNFFFLFWGDSKEAFIIVFKFLSPDGNIIDIIHVAISPSGTKTLLNLLDAEMRDYEGEHGQVEPWGKQPVKSQSTQNSNSEKYVA